MVFGDIGTSPLYAVRECFTGSHSLDVLPSNILGVLSLIFWSLILIITAKYLFYVLRADNRGEGGILALASLVRGKDESGFRYRFAALLGLFGASLLYGDGMITPAISVLSALEGLNVVTPVFNSFVVPLTIGILIGLFLLQSRGTSGIGFLFGPVMLVWFTCIGLLGLFSIVKSPGIFQALNPYYGFSFLTHSGGKGFFVLGAVFLVVTGGEALYADLGHFGRSPIRKAWFFAAAPGLLLNYFGQGALLLRSPEAAINPFYKLVPSSLLIPAVVLATCATIIASQAVITGVFSVTRQAVQLGFLPRLRIIHTSSEEKGQIFMPDVNIFLAIATITLVLGFQESSNLAAAYGIAVSIDMLITSLLAYRVSIRLWNWKWGWALMLTTLFVCIDLSFLGANIIKIKSGGWVPLVVAGVLVLIFTTWKKGQQKIGKRIQEEALPLSFIIKDCEAERIHRVPGTAVYFSATPGIVPPAMLHNMKHYKVIHEKNIFVTVKTEEVPFIPYKKRVHLETVGPEFYTMVVRYGFMQHPEIPTALQHARDQGLKVDPQSITYILSRNQLKPTHKRGFWWFREVLFSALHRNALGPADFFHLPSNQVIEIGRIMKI